MKASKWFLNYSFNCFNLGHNNDSFFFEVWTHNLLDYRIIYSLISLQTCTMFIFYGAQKRFKAKKNFPFSSCTSISNNLCHFWVTLVNNGFIIWKKTKNSSKYRLFCSTIWKSVKCILVNYSFTFSGVCNLFRYSLKNENFVIYSTACSSNPIYFLCGTQKKRCFDGGSSRSGLNRQPFAYELRSFST